ncbi:TPA: hypothetical protein DDW35_10945 [Candidatus Sumerlaeota bacterium]|nr:hypothetical protein [Candidatus Sumerlaeota bacterium]
MITTPRERGFQQPGTFVQGAAARQHASKKKNDKTFVTVFAAFPKRHLFIQWESLGGKSRKIGGMQESGCILTMLYFLGFVPAGRFEFRPAL